MIKYTMIGVDEEFKEWIASMAIGKETYQQILKRLCSYDSIKKTKKEIKNHDNTQIQRAA